MGSCLKVILLSLAVINAVQADVAYPVRRFFHNRLVKSAVQSRGFCPENYYPCTCESTENGLEVRCIDVDTASIQKVFYDTKTRDLYSVTISASPSTVPDTVELTQDLLSDKQVRNVYLKCPVKPAGSTPEKIALTIHDDTFRYTRDYTTRFEMENCDLATSVGFKFLLDFSVLRELIVLRSINVNLDGLPPLPALATLTLTDSEGIEANAANFPILTPARLSNLSANGCGLTDAGTSTILTKIGSSTSASSLAMLDFSNNGLTYVPTEIHSMAKLSYLNLSSNSIESTKVGDLSFVASVTGVNLEANNLANMAAKTFEYGDFTKAEISFRNNMLTGFLKDVFYGILSQMRVQPVEVGGYVDVADNPFTCRCEIAWLIRDNRDLLPYVRNGKCDGFYKFEDLNPNSYIDCPPS